MPVLPDHGCKCYGIEPGASHPYWFISMLRSKCLDSKRTLLEADGMALCSARESVVKIEALIWIPFWKGSQISTLQIKSWFKSKTSIQEYRIEIKKLILNLWMNCIIHVSSTMWRDKNQPSNFISCSENALHLLVLDVGILYWGLQVTSSFSIWGCVLKGCFEKCIFWRTKLRLKGIDDFNLEYCRKIFEHSQSVKILAILNQLVTCWHLPGLLSFIWGIFYRFF